MPGRKFGELSVIHQTKPSTLVVTINNPLADLSIRQTFFRQTPEKSKFTKHSPRQTFSAIQYLLAVVIYTCAVNQGVYVCMLILIL